MADVLDLGDGDSLLLDDSGDELLLETLPATVAELLADTGARIEIVVKGIYLDEDDIAHIEWISQSGWDDEVSGPAATYIPPLLSLGVSGLSVDHQIEPLEPISSLDVIGTIEISNNHLDYAGRYDPWWRYSVDNLAWTIYTVGILSDGRRVELSSAIDSPLYELKGIGIPEVGSDNCKINCRDSRSLDTALQPVTYSPPALLFPATSGGVIDLGNNLNITGAQSISVWVYLRDITTTQYILFKDSSTTGYELAVGAVGGGSPVIGGVELIVRGQTPASTVTAANVLRTFRWHRIDISIDTTSRRIDIDGVTSVTTAGVTGTPLSSTTTLTIGANLNGRLSRILYWSNARSNATMSAEGRIPITGTESNLREAFDFHEGSGLTVHSIKSGSSLTGTLNASVLWDNASWHYESLLGQYEPYVLGTVPRVPVTWIDPPKQIGQISRGPIALFSELQSNHTAVSSANYTANLSSGIFTVTSGALSGSYSATITANNLWNSALLFDGVASSATATITMPAASKYIGAHFRNDIVSASTQHIAGWIVSGTTSAFWLRTLNGVLSIFARNDAGTLFGASVTISKGQEYSALGSLDTANPSTGLKLYLDGALVATTAISGAWTVTQTPFGVGRRSGLTDWFTGRIDEVVIGNTAATLAMAKSYHAIPSTSAMSGIINGWHFDDATGTTATAFAGATSLTLASIAWTAGRSTPVDLARSILYSEGIAESSLDAATWLIALNKCKADCGWFVAGGAKSIDVINAILGGLGFVIYGSGGLIKIDRFEGLSGTVDITLDPDIDFQSAPIEAIASDPPIYQWTINFATNNSKQDANNIAGGLATTDPDRYQYGSVSYRSVTKSDGSILSRFPNAEHRSRTTALLNLYDAEIEAARLLAIHRYGADRKQLAMFAANNGIEILTEIGPLMAETDLDNIGTLLVTGISTDGEQGALTIWRPAV